MNFKQACHRIAINADMPSRGHEPWRRDQMARLIGIRNMTTFNTRLNEAMIPIGNATGLLLYHRIRALLSMTKEQLDDEIKFTGAYKD